MMSAFKSRPYSNSCRQAWDPDSSESYQCGQEQQNRLIQLLPPQPTAEYGETIVASNPFDDAPAPPSKTMSNTKIEHEDNIMRHHQDQHAMINYTNRVPIPNSPQIYPCGACYKEVRGGDKAILCESGCNLWFHGICTGLTEPAYHFLIEEVYAEWVCNKCLGKKTVPPVKFKA